MLSLLKTENKPLDFTDRVKKWRGRRGGKKAATTLPYRQKKKKKSYFNICILDSSILPSNHMKLQEENIKAKKKRKRKRQLSISIQKPRMKSLSR